MSDFIVTKKDQNISLRNFIKLKFSDLSTRDIERLLAQNGCEVNNSQQRFGSTKLLEGDSIKVFSSFLGKTLSKVEPITTIYQDDHLIVINKPSGIASSIKDLQPHFNETLYLVHRLDKMTSGVLILAKTKEAQAAIEKLFFSRSIEKTYLAITHGRTSTSAGEIEDPIKLKKRFEGGVIYQTAKYGKKASTSWKRLALGKAESFLQLKPKTGRTHQIRVHLSSLGYPIIGDAVYTKESISNHKSPRMLLHAYKIEFTHPFTSKMIAIIAPLPIILNKTISKLFKRHKICAF
ncbi:MAG: hypothetical protein S4CHLAM7_01030 [Chlamydiae bacterium]|nr:hypothetical protein [Chlamydiota bacterium]